MSQAMWEVSSCLQRQSRDPRVIRGQSPYTHTLTCTDGETETPRGEVRDPKLARSRDRVRTEAFGIQSRVQLLRVGSPTSSLNTPWKLIEKANSRDPLAPKLWGKAIVWVSSRLAGDSDPC